MLSRSILTYAAPSAPLAGTSPLHRLAAYRRCLRCAYSHMPRRPTTGSELSLMLFRNMSSSETTGNPSVAHTQYFTEDAGLQLQLTVSAFPSSSHSDSGEGDCFRGLTTVRLRYDLLLCLPSCRSRPDSHPAYEDVYFRAFDGLVARPVAGYYYSANWETCTGGTFTR